MKNRICLGIGSSLVILVSILFFMTTNAMAGIPHKAPKTRKPFLMRTGHSHVETCNRFSTETGKASWYGAGFEGRTTASGESFSCSGRTAAHPFLPFGTKVRVTNVENGKSVVVRINDRMGQGKRIIDLSEGAAKHIDMIEKGIVKVRVDKLTASVLSPR